VYVTHDQEEALAMSDWVAVMNAGRLVQWGTPEDVYVHPRTPFMADFIGSVNLIRASVLASAATGMHVRAGELEMDLTPNHVARKVGDEVVLSIRPETLTLLPGHPANDRRTVTCPGRVVRRTYFGHSIRYVVHAAGLDWIVHQPDPGATAPLEGDVTLGVDPTRVHVIPESD
jgi:ABC-type Fe3+/spermidine/putrescine transport system ATPase subunit